VSFGRYVAFDDFMAFGDQLIPRTLTNDLPGNVLLHGRILVLEPLKQSAYPLLKARRFTSPMQQIRTRLLAKTEAAALLDGTTLLSTRHSRYGDLKELASYPVRDELSVRAGNAGTPVTVYVRTDRTGRVREAYTDRNDVYNQYEGAVARAMLLKFRPLIVDGAPQQIEAPIEIR